MLTDELERQGIDLPVMGGEAQRRLQSVLPPESSTANPIDCLPTRTASQVGEVFRIIEEEERGKIDLIAIQVANPGMSDNREMYREVARAMEKLSIPVIPVLTSVSTCADLIGEFTGNGRFCFHDEVNLGVAIGKVLRRPRVYDARGELSGYDFEGIARILEGRSGALDSAGVGMILAKAGFLIPRQRVVASPDELSEACGAIGFPVAMKVEGPLHKSDLGGVRVGVADVRAARATFGELMALEGARGVLVQEMVAGTEVIFGSSRSGDMGHVVMFGLGGIYTAALKDVQFALAPLAPEECREMVTGIKAFPIIEGVRGQSGMSQDLLMDYAAKVGRLVTDFPSIREIDLNPVKGYGRELYVVDARIILE